MSQQPEAFDPSPEQNRPESQPWSELLAGYALGDLTPEDAIAVKQYLDAHPEAIAEVQALQQTLALIPLSLPAVPLPPELESRILQAATSSSPQPLEPARIQPPLAQTPTNRPVPWKSRRRFRQGWPLAAGIAAAAIAALGVQSYQVQRELVATRQALAQLRQTQESLVAQQRDLGRYQQAIATLEQAPSHMLNLAGSGLAAKATGNVVVSPQQRQALLMVKNLPQPPAGKIYHLWALVEGRKVACVQFTPEADGQVLMQLPADRWVKAVGVVITLEPLESEAQPTGEMIMSAASHWLLG
jgi:anti-sigma factor RsiW